MPPGQVSKLDFSAIKRAQSPKAGAYGGHCPDVPNLGPVGTDVLHTSLGCGAIGPFNGCGIYRTVESEGKPSKVDVYQHHYAFHTPRRIAQRSYCSYNSCQLSIPRAENAAIEQAELHPAG